MAIGFASDFIDLCNYMGFHGLKKVQDATAGYDIYTDGVLLTTAKSKPTKITFVDKAKIAKHTRENLSDLKEFLDMEDLELMMSGEDPSDSAQDIVQILAYLTMYKGV